MPYNPTFSDAIQEQSMARSMTGFARLTGELGGETVVLEVTAVNHRFLDCSFRLPYAWGALETPLKELVRRQVARGKLNVNVRRAHGPAGRPSIQCDFEVAQQYLDACRELAHRMSTTEALSLNTLVALPGIFQQQEETADLDGVRKSLEVLLGEALAQLNAARDSEGAALAEDVQARTQEMREALAVVEERLPDLTAGYEERLLGRVRDLNVEAGLSQDRLMVEVALLAEKGAVNEEVVRLKAHFDHVGELLASGEPIGRDLDFLCQEIQREVNTLGSKIRDLGVTREVLRMKSQLEKLREQAQNLE
jgi:uncharacterized protein (TIGR00255 family)